MDELKCLCNKQDRYYLFTVLHYIQGQLHERSLRMSIPTTQFYVSHFLPQNIAAQFDFNKFLNKFTSFYKM
jgi:hypothetical protein